MCWQKFVNLLSDRDTYRLPYYVIIDDDYQTPAVKHMKSRLDDQRAEFPPFGRKFEPNSVNFSLDSPVLCLSSFFIETLLKW